MIIIIILLTVSVFSCRWLHISPTATCSRSTWFWCCAQLWISSLNSAILKQLQDLRGASWSSAQSQMLHSRLSLILSGGFFHHVVINDSYSFSDHFPLLWFRLVKSWRLVRKPWPTPINWTTTPTIRLICALPPLFLCTEDVPLRSAPSLEPATALCTKARSAGSLR